MPRIRENGHPAHSGALRDVPPPGVRGLGNRASRAPTRSSSSTRSTTEAPADGRLPALPRHALRRSHPRTGDADQITRARGDCVDPELADRPARIPCLRLPRRPPRGIRHKKSIESPALRLYDRRSTEAGASAFPAAARDAGRRARRQDEPRSAPGALLPVPRAAVHPADRVRRRPHSHGRPRRPELPRLPRQARPDRRAPVVRHLPSAPVELRPRRREDGHDLQGRQEQAQRPLGEVRRLPPKGVPPRKARSLAD